MNLCSWIHFHLWVLQEKKVRLSMKRFDQSFRMRTLLRKYVTVAKPFFRVYFSKNKRMHSSRMRTARLLTVSRSIPYVSGEGVCPTLLDAHPHWMQTHPWMQTPYPWMQIDLDADPPPLDADPPWRQTPLWMQTPQMQTHIPLDADHLDAYIPKMQIPKYRPLHLDAHPTGCRPPWKQTPQSCDL